MRVLFWLLPMISLLLVSCSTTSQKNVSGSAYELASMLTGEFDSSWQMKQDEAAGVSKEMAHGWVTRIFVEVEAPAVGSPVLVGTTYYGGVNGTMDTDEFLVWTFTPSDTDDTVVMSPRRFKDFEDRISYSTDASKLAGFSSDDLEGAISGAACDIVWRRNEAGFTGRTKPCYVMSTTQKRMLNWVWEFELTQDALWIAFKGQDETGAIKDGTPKGFPYRLDRLPISEN